APEIAQQLGFPVCFVPHLLPVRRGLLATCYVRSDADLRGLLEDAYAGSEVVRLLPEAVAPELGRVQGTDAAEIALFDDAATGTARWTQTRVLAAPVVISKAHLSLAEPQAVVVNSGVANAATGERGEIDALATAAETARLLGIDTEEVIVLSTGVIGAPLPLD